MPVCLNHPHVEETQPCAQCGRPFCDRCLVEITGRKLCNECKAFSVTGVVSRPERHPQAILALLIPVVGYVFCLTPVTSTIGLFMGRRVLQEIEREPNLSGRSVALAAVVVSGGTLATFAATLVAIILFWLTGR